MRLIGLRIYRLEGFRDNAQNSNMEKDMEHDMETGINRRL